MLNLALNDYDQLVTAVRAELLQRDPLIIGFRDDGTDLHLRFRAALGTSHVVVHVQGAGVGEGGGTYSETDYVSSDVVDCRESRLQDFSRASGHFWIWLIPLDIDSFGTIKFNGLNGAPDNMAFIEMGA